MKIKGVFDHKRDKLRLFNSLPLISLEGVGFLVTIPLHSLPNVLQQIL